MTHTKGPWHAEDRNWSGEPAPHKLYISGGEWEDEEDGSRCATAVCIVEGNAMSKQVTQANAALIAAAPELLAACEATKRWIEEAMIDLDDLSGDAKCILGEVATAIAKAKGNS